MASRKGISMGFLFLICLGISSAHRLLLDSIDDNKPKESTFNLPGGGNGGGVGLSGTEGNGVGFGYLRSDFGSNCGADQNGHYGLGDGCGLAPKPRYGILEPYPPADYWFPEPYPPADSCTCPCPCNGGGWARLNSPNNSPAHLEPEFAGSMDMPIAGSMGLLSDGSNMGAHNEPITSNDAKDHHEAHQARSGYGPFKVPTNDGEPMPPDNSEPKPPPPPDNIEPNSPPKDGEPMPGNQGMKT